MKNIMALRKCIMPVLYQDQNTAFPQVLYIQAFTQTLISNFPYQQFTYRDLHKHSFLVFHFNNFPKYASNLLVVYFLEGWMYVKPQQTWPNPKYTCFVWTLNPLKSLQQTNSGKQNKLLQKTEKIHDFSISSVSDVSSAEIYYKGYDFNCFPLLKTTLLPHLHCSAGGAKYNSWSTTH